MSILVAKIGAILAALTLILSALVVMQVKDFSLGSAPPGLPAFPTIATTTEIGPDGDIDGNPVTIFTKKTSCTSRIISTTDGSNQAIQLIFEDPSRGTDISSTTLSEIVGHFQAGSTTKAYDAGIYGCGRWTAFANASTTLMLSENN